MEITTIKLEKETKQRLEKLKEHQRETFNDVIRKILYILNTIRRDSNAGSRLMGSIDKSIRRKQVINKRVKEEEVKEISSKFS